MFALVVLTAMRAAVAADSQVQKGTQPSGTPEVQAATAVMVSKDSIPSWKETLRVNRLIEPGAEVAFSTKAFPATAQVEIKDLAIAVSLRSVAIGAAPMAFIGDNRNSDDYALIEYTIVNLSRMRKAQYTRPNRFLAKNNAGLVDEHKNTYKWIEFPAGVRLIGRPDTDIASIYPGDRLQDVIAFEEPVAAARVLIFSLPVAVFSEGDKRRLSFKVEISGILDELHRRRSLFASARKTGIPGLMWRMTIDEVRKLLPALKKNDSPAWASGLPFEEWYIVQGSIAGNKAAAIDAWFYSGELYRLEIRSPDLSESKWVEIVKSELGEPTNYRGHPVWHYGPGEFMVFDEGGDRGTDVRAWYTPLRVLEPKH